MNNIIRFAVTLGTLIGANAASLAQTYPDRPVKIVVPFAPAGPTDVIARIVADKLSISLGKQFYVENRAGAGGNTGTAAVAASPADGYTLIAVATGFVVNPSLFAKVPYDPVKDFAPISIVAVSPNVVTVNPSVPAKSVNELIALIKANPGKFSFASPGVGSKDLSKIGPAERTTPAGRFVARYGQAAGGQTVLWVDWSTSVALHAVVTGNRRERRLERLLSPSPVDNRITFGCINVPTNFYNEKVRPLFRRTGGVVYVLPDTKPLETVFPGVLVHQASADRPS